MDFYTKMMPETTDALLLRIHNYISQIVKPGNVRLTLHLPNASLTGIFHAYHECDNRAVIYVTGINGARDDFTVIDAKHVVAMTVHDASDIAHVLAPNIVGRPLNERALSPLEAKRVLSDLTDRIRAVMAACPLLTIESAYDPILWSNGLDVMRVFTAEIESLGADSITTAFFAGLAGIVLHHKLGSNFVVTKSNSIVLIKADLSIMPSQSLPEILQSAINAIID